MEFHPLANIFPLMTENEIDELAADIAEHCQREPIYTWEGKILDGRNRYLACDKIKVAPWFKEWDGEGDPVAFVVSMNLHRRHLNESQRSMVADNLAMLNLGANQHKNQGAQICAPSTSLSQERAAELLNVSRRSVQNARTVREQGEESLVAAVEAGEVSVSDASKVANKPAPIQQAALDAVKTGQAKTLAEAAKKTERDLLPPDTPPGITDARGRLVPEPYLAIFATRDEFVALGRLTDELKRAVDEVAESPAGYYLRKELQHLNEKFRQIRFVVTRSAPFSIATGKRNEPKWVSEVVWRSLSDEERGG